ncbi:spermatogenesis-associated protein 6 [Hylaeus volcanicus]|uniref:spermatogenesis-associated protein 6 n=1 Tax=Hylaeus volcanicus TaxID=313075 RepID=UPI0023B7B963|nr:spermatogenesis-associated protein 6 [Hylaeus volcanicus]
MAGRGFRVKVQLDLHAVTCPGVWLCPNGKIALRMTTIGSTLESHRVSPIFPLLFHNEFNFKKTFTRLATLTELQRKLEQEFLYAELIQWVSPCNQTVVLATFETNLADVLYPVPHYKGLMPGIDVDLLMDPTKYFPGIIAPKIEISTKTVIEEVSDVCNANVDKAYVVNPKTINSKRTSCVHRKRPVKGIIRQRKVCHSRAKPRGQICRAINPREQFLSNDQQRLNECYHPTRRNLRGVTTICGNAHIFDSCPVCLKYKCYFACECNEPSDGGRKQIIEPVESFESFIVDDSYDIHRSCTCGGMNDNSVSQEPTSTAQPRIRYLRKKEKFYCPSRGCGENISECDAFYAQHQPEEKQGFYTNLERFYKRMYKQAKLGARQVKERS